MRKLVLFDIDGTIMNTDSGGASSCQETLQEIFNRPVSLDDYMMSGKTDTQIVLELMEREGVDRDVTTENLDAIYDGYIDRLNREVAVWDPEICPGIPVLVESLSQMDEVLLGLLTGNIKRGAEVKLNQIGLWSYFKTGAFGDRAPERKLLPGIAQKVAEEQIGKRFEKKDIVIIGDTPNDILCGRDLNVKAIAVATGSYDVETLGSYDPDYLFEDLSDTDRVVEAIMST